MVISGATGAKAAAINGVLEPTQEKGLDGRVLYCKRGDGRVCMEHFAGKWQVKSVSMKGKNSCYASVAGGCAAEACTSRIWKVWDGKAFADAPLMKMAAEVVTKLLSKSACLFAIDYLSSISSILNSSISSMSMPAAAAAAPQPGAAGAPLLAV